MTQKCVIAVVAALTLAACSSEQIDADAGLDAAADLSRDLAPADATAPDAAAPDQAGPDLAQPDFGPMPDAITQALPSLGKVTMYVNMGDSIAAGDGVSNALTYHGLLSKNQDARYPAYKGKSLADTFPGIKVVDRSKGGSTSAHLATQAAGAPANTTGNTLVVISIGGNDMMYNYASMLDPAQAKALAQKVVANVAKVKAHFADKKKYPNKTHFVLFNVYEWTDTMGTIPAGAKTSGACGLMKQVPPALGQLVMKNHALFNQEMMTFAKTSGWLIGDLRAAFVGHGFNHNNKACPCYKASDPTLWLQGDCIHPTVRGHHEIRRVVWRTLFGK